MTFLENSVKPVRVAVVTNVIPHYNGPLYERLVRRGDLDLKVYCQAAIPGTNLELVHDRFPEHVTIVPSLCLPRDRLGWQWLPWRVLLSSFDVMFVIGNPRILSNVALACVARILGKPVVIWAQGRSMNASATRERLRLLWWRMFHNIFVYTDPEARWLKSRGFEGRNVVGMNNGLDQKRIDAAAALWDAPRLEAWRREQNLVGRTIVLSCARLEPKNAFDLWLTAMPAVVSRVPNLTWCVIGDGQEREKLEARARELGLSEHVRWLGTIVDEPALAPWFLCSRILVHPAGIGLTLLHAFGYGLPVVTHGDSARHNPEFGAFEVGQTGWVYQRGDPASLADTVCRALADEVGLRRMGEVGRRIAREEYNVDVMVERFVAMAKRAAAQGSAHGVTEPHSNRAW